MKEPSAVDFLHSKILFNIGLDDNDIFKLRELVKIAKKLEDKQHGKTWDAALDAGQSRAWNVMRAYEDFDDWYAETFVSKGSDDHISDISKMVEDDVDKFEKFLDKEIELELSPKDTIERIKWYYKVYFKQPKKD